MRALSPLFLVRLAPTGPISPSLVRLAAGGLPSVLRALRQPYSSSLPRSPAPPRLPPAEQAEFERLQHLAAVAAAAAAAADSSSSPSSSSSSSSSPPPPEDAAAPPAGAEFEGERNPRTGEVGGPKREPLRWGTGGDWSYGGRVTDF